MKAAIDRAIGTIAEKRMFIVGLYVDPGINLDNQSSTAPVGGIEMAIVIRMEKRGK